ncbi:hypothetical protein OPV22_030276 [Ensete ventricosum]|uniref:Uncharacterized protein n=1 Tax=Ensete ventricosum TaxID=4639 RepID=A0AAV8QFU7_ENSVE|nr:hypothetical protein OPV22_030276 [Ensete ventricosum]
MSCLIIPIEIPPAVNALRAAAEESQGISWRLFCFHYDIGRHIPSVPSLPLASCLGNDSSFVLMLTPTRGYLFHTTKALLPKGPPML